MKSGAIQGQIATRENEESSFFHHRRKLVNLNWDHEPKRVSLFIQSGLIEMEKQIETMKKFLIDMDFELEVDVYTDSDFIILVGTDGFNLQISSIFQDRETPPIISLTPHKKGFISFIEFCSYQTVIPQILRGNCFILPRCRLCIDYHSSEGIERFTALNDLVVNRDQTCGSLIVNCSSCGFGFSQIICDGVIIATPTGSTAYNKGAGGALVHPLLPVFMLTPIIALSLSARPIMFPQSADLTISLACDTKRKQKAYIVFDGTGHRTFSPGEKLVISISTHYFNSIMMNKSIAEWPVRLAGLMSWNERKHQKALPKNP